MKRVSPLLEKIQKFFNEDSEIPNFFKRKEKKETIENISYLTPQHIISKAFSELNENNFVKYKFIEEEVKKIWPEARLYSNGYKEMTPEELTETTIEQVMSQKYKNRTITMIMFTNTQGKKLNGYYKITNKNKHEKLCEEYNNLIGKNSRYV